MTHIFDKSTIDNDGIARHPRIHILINCDAITHENAVNLRYNAIRVNLTVRNAMRCLTPSKKQYKTRENDNFTHNICEPPTRAF